MRINHWLHHLRNSFARTRRFRKNQQSTPLRRIPAEQLESRALLTPLTFSFFESQVDITGTRSITIPNEDTAGSDDNLTADVNATSSGVNPNGGHLSVEAGDDLVVNAGVTLFGNLSLELNVDHYGSRGVVFPAPVDPDPGVGGFLDLGGRLSGSNISLFGHTDNDDFFISANSIDLSDNFTVDGWEGSDTAFFDLTGSTNAVLTRTDAAPGFGEEPPMQQLLTLTDPSGDSKTFTLNRIETVQTSGGTATFVDADEPDWDFTSEITIVGNTVTGADLANSQLQSLLTDLVTDVDDADLDITANPTTFPFGTTSVVFTATDDAGNSANHTIDVTVEQPALTVSIAADSIAEAGGAAATTVTVSRNTETTNALVVNLSSSDTSEASVSVSSITIPAGQPSATFSIDAVNDDLPDGDVTVTITATAADHADGTDTLDVINDDIVDLTVLIADDSFSEADGAAATTATVTRTGPTTNAVTLTLASDDTSAATVPATVVIDAGQTSATFDIDAVNDDVVDDTQTVTVTASAVAHNNGTDTVDVTNEDVPTLTVAILAGSIAEDAGSGATTAVVSRNSDTTNPLSVTLSSSDIAELSVPSTVTIAAGETTSPLFFLGAVTDDVVDGLKVVTVTATATDHADGTDEIEVTDVDVPTLTVTIDDFSVNEGDGTAATTGTVSRNTDAIGELIVNLSSDDESEATVPTTVTIEAGQMSATFDIDAIDDSDLDGSQTVTVTATTTGFADGTGTINVADDEFGQLIVSKTGVDGDVDDGNHVDGELTLREAIGLANTDGNNTEIVFAESVHGTTITLAGTQLPLVEVPIRIVGPGSDELTIDGNNQSRIFTFGPDAEITGVTLMNGSISGSFEIGGAIQSYSSLTVRDSTLTNNTADYGGAIGAMGSFGRLTIDNVTFSGNSANSGGAVDNSSVGTISNSIFDNNMATSGSGGAIFNGAFDSETGEGLTIVGSTISGNSASQSGGGIQNYGSLTVSNSTIAGNASAVGSGGGIGNGNGITLHLENVTIAGQTEGGGLSTGGSGVEIRNTLIAGNLDNGVESDVIASEAIPAANATNSLFGTPDATSGLSNDSDGDPATGTNNIVVGDWKTVIENDGTIPTLTNNDGGTETIALLPDGPAVDAGGTSSESFDQRGLSRLIDGNGDGMFIVDIGAVESPTPELGSVLISTSSVTVAEGGDSGRYAISLDMEPSGDVEITLTPDANVEVSSDGTTFSNSLVLIFSDANAQEVIVRAVDDSSSEGVHNGMVTHAITGTVTDFQFPNTLLINTITANITDNDPGNFTLSKLNAVVSEDGTTDTFTVVLDSQPASDVKLNLGSSDETEATVAPVALTFTTADWNVPQLVTITGVDDPDRDGDQQVQITVSVDAAASDDTYDNLPPQVVSTIAVDPESSLQVTDISATASGFVFTFSEAVDGTAVSLSDVVAESDLTITGNVTGALRGSLIFGGNPNTVIFLSTDGLLPEDTYQITLSSGEGGWKSTGGKQLDGNGDGAAGDDFTQSVTVAEPARGTVTLSLPKFVRGAGQDVALSPSAGIPLTLSNANGVAEVRFFLEYDSALLQVTSFVGEVAGAQVIAQPAGLGRMFVRVARSSPFADTDGPLVLGHFLASVPDDAPYSTKQLMNLSSLEVKNRRNGTINSVADAGIHITSYQGDLDGDVAVAISDVILLQRQLALLDGNVPGFQQTDIGVVGDSNLDNALTVGDAIVLQRFVALLDTPTIPDPPSNVTPATPTGPDPKVFIDQDLTGAIGTTVTVPIQLEVTEQAGINVAGFSLIIGYDQDVFDVSNVQQGALLGGGLSGSPNTSTPGTIIIPLSKATGADLNFGDTGVLATVDFTVKATAAEGATPINILADFGRAATTVNTEVNGAALTLVPAPTNASNDSVDGIFTVTPADTTVPTVTVTPNSGTTSDNPILFTFQFSEVVTGFEAGDVTLTNGTAGTFTAVNGDTYTLGVVPTSDGDVTATVAAGAANDASANASTAGSGTVTFATADTTPPTVTVTPNSGTTADNPILFTFQFSEVVTGFEAGDVTLTNGTAGTFTAVDGDTYTLGVVPTSDGDVTATVAAGAANDASANASTAGSGTVTFAAADTTAPTVTITPSSGSTTDDPIEFTFQFSETVTGFEQADINVANGTGRTFTAFDGDTYSLTVVPQSAGTVSVTVTAGSTADVAGNAIVETTASITSNVNPAATAPTLTQSPGTTDQMQPTLDWADVAGATGYEIWFASVTPVQTRLFSGNSLVTASEWAPPSNLDPAHYRYWVRTVAANGARGPWSSSQEFDVRPTLTGPLAPTFTARPTFTWDAIPNATGYEIFIRTQDSSIGNNGDIVDSTIPAGTTSYTPSVDLPGGTIRWWVRATDARGNRGWSDVGVTGNRSAIITADDSQIVWQAVSGAGRYVLHVEDDSGQVVIRQDQLDDTTFSLSGLVTAGNYRAWVKAIDSETDLFATGFWSRGVNFSVAQLDSRDTTDEESMLTSLEGEPVKEAPVTSNELVANSTQEKVRAQVSSLPDRGSKANGLQEDNQSDGDTLAMVDSLMSDQFHLAEALFDALT